MLFRMIKRFTHIYYYLNFFSFFLNERYSKLENDYSRFIRFILINLFYEGLIKYIIYCIESTIFLIYVQIQATNIVLRFVFIKCVVNTIFFIWDCYNEEYRYLLFEFIYMFVYLYTFDFKFQIIKFFYTAINYWKYFNSRAYVFSELNFSETKFVTISNKKFKLFIIQEDDYYFLKERVNEFPLPDIQLYSPIFFRFTFEQELVPAYSVDTNLLYYPDKPKEPEPEIFEMTEEEYKIYRDNLSKRVAPDLQIYYPMRFALSSVMIRLTGVILSISLLLILFFNFVNLFILSDLNFGELRRFVTYRLTELFVPYESFYQTYFKGETINYYADENDEIPEHKINNIYSRLKYWFVLVLFVLKNAHINLAMDFYNNADVINFFLTIRFYLNFFYNFLSLIFIYTLPIHFYYVFNHSYNLISIIRNIFESLLNILRKIVGIFYRISKFSAIKSWKMYKVVKDAEDLPINYQQTKFVEKINEEEMTLKEYFKRQEELYVKHNNDINNINIKKK